MKRLMLLAAIAAAVLMTAGQVDADGRVRRRGRYHYGDGVLSFSFSFGRPVRVYHYPPVYRHPRYRPPRPRPCHQPCCYPYRRSTYFRHPGPGGRWIRYGGSMGYRHGPYVYYPIRTYGGIRRYRRVYVRP